MALVIADRVKETSLTTGTATIVLAGAVGGFQPFSVIGNGNTTYYCIAGQGSNQWEVGIGTYTASGTTLSRDTVLSSSAGGTTKVTFSSGAKDVFVTYPSEKSVNLDASGNVTALGDVASGVWKGTTRATTYGGTGLSGATPFTAANNAVYSTSATALTAGTLPVDAGGTGLASYTAGDLSYYTAGTALSKLPIGASTTILTSSSVAPQWSATSGISVGNATTADTLTTARNIAGVSFDGSANIAIPLSNLSDVSIDTPVVNQLLGYNGAVWGNVAPNPASAGTGVVFYNATPVITAAGANSDVAILTFASIPVTTAEQVITGTAVSNTVLFSAFVTVALNRLIFDAGIYDFTIWAGVDSIAGNSVTTITRQIYTATPFVVGTVTTTGTGSSRTATASSGTPFATAAIDASATNTVASYLQTPQGIYQITARTSDTVVTITTPSGYTNESAVAGTVWKKLFGITTPEITSISPNYTVFDVVTTQPSTVVTTATKMGILGFVTSNATRTISLTYNGKDRNTHVNTPLANLHNDLAGLQGGTATEYFHSTSAEYTGTGSGVFVRATSPTLVTPALGTPSALVGTNITGTATAFTASNVTTNANLTGGVTSVGNAATVITNANLTGGVTSVGNATTVVTNANLTGEATSVGNAATLTNSAVIGKVITGYVSGAGAVAATDTILQAIQKLNGNDATNANLTGVITSSGNATAIASQTGTGSTFVVNTSPVLVTPNLGTPSAGTLTNCTFPTLNQDTTGTAAKANALNSATTVVNVSSAAAPTVGQILMATSGTAATWQTPAAGGVTTVGFGTTGLTPSAATGGVVTVSGTLVVANGGTGVTSSTGTVAVVLSTSPTLVTPLLGTPTSGVMSNCTVDGTDAVGFRNVPINSQSAAYPLVLADAGKCIFHPSSDANARTFTIPANGSVAYALGTAITFINMTSQVVTIAITTDTMYLSSAGTTGSRSLAQYGSATAIKMTSTTWLISGSGLT